MKYAVIQVKGKQYRVEEGSKLTLPNIEHTTDTLVIEDVLLAVDGDKVTIGTPLVSTAKVTLKIISEQRSKKIRVAKYKSKSRYRRVYGHRQPETSVEITTLSF